MGERDVYFARLTFYRDINQVKVQARFSKKGRTLKLMVDMPEDIHFGELDWQRIRNKYLKGMFAIYERKNLSNYVNCFGIDISTSLNQRLERLLAESLKK